MKTVNIYGWNSPTNIWLDCWLAMWWSPTIRNNELKCKINACARLWFLGHLPTTLFRTLTHTLKARSNDHGHQAWWHTPVISALGDCKLEARLGFEARSSKNKAKPSNAANSDFCLSERSKVRRPLSLLGKKSLIPSAPYFLIHSSTLSILWLPEAKTWAKKTNFSITNRTLIPIWDWENASLHGTD